MSYLEMKRIIGSKVANRESVTARWSEDEKERHYSDTFEAAVLLPVVFVSLFNTAAQSALIWCQHKERAWVKQDEMHNGHD